MKIAHVWYRREERDLIKGLIDVERPDWELTGISETRVGSFPSLLKLLGSGNDALLVHLSLPYCLALKAAELAHQNSLSTRILLFWWD